MELQQVLRIIWKRLWLIMIGTLLVSAFAFVLGEKRTPLYQAEVTMMVNQSANALFADYTSLSTGEDLALTYTELLRARPLLETVITNLNLDISPDKMRREMLRTELVRGTQLVRLTVKDTNPQRASDIANEIAFTFISLHNTDQQVESIAALEEEIVAQMASVKELIDYSQSAVGQPSVSSGLLTEEESNQALNTLAGQQNAYANLLATYLNVRRIQTQLLDVTLVEPAVPATRPIGRSSVFYAFLGAFVGLNLSAGLVVLMDYLDRSFETADDIRQVLSLPALGTIHRPHGKERESDLVTAAFPRSPMSEAYRTLRTNIRFTSVDRPVKSVLITSAEPGAGKTTVTANLGVVCAQAGLQVVLIDTDLRRPSLSRMFNLSNHTGLTDLLVGDLQDVEACMASTGIDNLRLITSGRIPPNPSELLGSKKMEAILADIRESADLVILDTSPTLAVTDPAVLATKVDGVILLVEAEQTSHEAARRALEIHEHVGATILGTVLTKSKAERRSYYYYYGEETEQSQHTKWTDWLRRIPQFLEKLEIHVK